MIMSRLGVHSKMVFNGDLSQSDLHDEESALDDAINILTKPTLAKGVGVVKLYDREDVQRHPLLHNLMERFGEIDDSPF
jgi:phosphate starvation-inducible PhoH-like protein